MLLVSAIQKERVGNRNCKCKTELSRECKIETRSREKMRTVTRKKICPNQPIFFLQAKTGTFGTLGILS